MSGGSRPDMRLAEPSPSSLELTVALPVGWTIAPQAAGDAFVCLPDEAHEAEGLRPSIQVERKAPVSAWPELLELARRSLEEMRRTYEQFDLCWERASPERLRVIRAYEFWVPELDRRVRQVQGLVAAGALYVINCTSPLVWADELEPLFRGVVDSVEAAP